MKTMLVTGGSGFIGRNVVETFQDKMIILSPTHRQLDLLSQEQVNNYIRDHEIDYIIHCANKGGSRKDPQVTDIINTNVRMYLNLAENSDRVKRLITFGSGAEYDKRQILSKVKETDYGRSIPVDEYGFSKFIISRCLETYPENVCLRLFGVFGKYEDVENRFISNAILKNFLEVPIHINQNVVFDYLYINDLMRILPSFLDSPLKYPVYNVTAGKPIDLVTIAHIINDKSNLKSKITAKKLGLNNEYTGDNTRLLEQIGDFKFTSIETAITELMVFYRQVI
jgi:GDP-L-fucose synthase